ncbi:MAG: septation protein SepH [Leucobacter sp.]
MDELRFVRRNDRALIVSSDTGEEFRLVVDDAMLSELRHLSRRERSSTAKVRPREIQALIRAGKTRAQIVEQTGLDEADIERYEEPVLAERRYILERAQAVPVRTEAYDDSEERFGEVIAERLISLGSDTSEWESWRDEEAGWMVSLEFISHDVAHRAVWSFDHRKGTLSPLNPDAVNLSKQGDVGDRLIPKLRAVDSGDETARSEAETPDAAENPEDEIDDPAGEAVSVKDAAAPPLADANAEYRRRLEIDQRAIKTVEAEPVDLSQTADLLDALRKRRGEREQSALTEEVRETEHPEAPEESGAAQAKGDRDRSRAPQSAPDEPSAPRSIWSAAGVSSGATQEKRPEPLSPGRAGRDTPLSIPGISDAKPAQSDRHEPAGKRGRGAGKRPGLGDRQDQDRQTRKGRASIPSWDDILFGTRSDEDPA